MFELDSRLATDSFYVGGTQLCQFLLANDSRFPWMILESERDELKEVFDLSRDDQTIVWRESMALTVFMKEYFSADNMNIATLGNEVAQLYLHHEARSRIDQAWPRPVWGSGEALPCDETEIDDLLGALRASSSSQLYFRHLLTFGILRAI